MKHALLCLSLMVPLGAAAQPFDVKLGAWEMTHKSSMQSRPMIEKECVTKADLAQLARGPDEDEGDCKFAKPPTVSGKKWSADKICGDQRVHSEFVAESPERVRGTVVASMPKGGKEIRFEISGRWIGTSCSGIK